MRTVLFVVLLCLAASPASADYDRDMIHDDTIRGGFTGFFENLSALCKRHDPERKRKTLSEVAGETWEYIKS